MRLEFFFNYFSITTEGKNIRNTCMVTGSLDSDWRCDRSLFFFSSLFFSSPVVYLVSMPQCYRLLNVRPCYACHVYGSRVRERVRVHESGTLLVFPRACCENVFNSLFLRSCMVYYIIISQDSGIIG